MILLKKYRRIFPVRLAFYPQCRPFVESGIGLEIGGPSSIFKKKGLFPAYKIASRIDNCNFAGNTTWEGEIKEGNTFHFNKNKAPGRQYINETSDLNCIASESYDFVLSSHCIEHLANPLQALSEWFRVIKEEGLLVLIVPHKDGTFDHRRPVTLLEHLIQDLHQQTGEGDMTHLEEILVLHDLTRDPEAGDARAFKERSINNFENRCLHQHVFDTRLAVEMIDYMNYQIRAVELYKPYHIVVIAQKLKRGETVNNTLFRELHPAGAVPFSPSG